MNNTFHFNKLKKINNKSIVVGVIGQGYVDFQFQFYFLKNLRFLVLIIIKI